MAPYLRKFGKFTVPDFVGETLLFTGRTHSGSYLRHLYLFYLLQGKCAGGVFAF